MARKKTTRAKRAPRRKNASTGGLILQRNNNTGKLSFVFRGKLYGPFDTAAERQEAINEARGWAPKKKNPKRKRKATAKRKRALKPKKRARVKRKANPKKRPAVRRKTRKAKRRRNGDAGLESAAKMYTKFHGKAPSGVRTVKQLRVTPDALADCGRLIELVVDTGNGGRKLTFKGVRVGTTGDGGQLYFVGGDQAIDLKQYPRIKLPKDQVELGECVSIAYHTSKDFHNFEPSDYEHAFGEAGGWPPTLNYDVHSRRLYLVGGSYQVKRAGIVN